MEAVRIRGEAKITKILGDQALIHGMQLQYLLDLEEEVLIGNPPDYKELLVATMAYLPKDLASKKIILKTLYPMYNIREHIFEDVVDPADAVEYAGYREAYTDVLAYAVNLLAAIQRNIVPLDKMAFLVAQNEVGLAGFITVFRYMNYCYMIGIQQYAPYFLADLILKKHGRPRLGRITEVLVPNVERYCRRHEMDYIAVHPLPHMQRILLEHYEFERSQEEPVDIPEWMPWVHAGHQQLRKYL